MPDCLNLVDNTDLHNLDADCTGLVGLRKLCKFKPQAVVLCRETKLDNLVSTLMQLSYSILHYQLQTANHNFVCINTHTLNLTG